MVIPRVVDLTVPPWDLLAALAPPGTSVESMQWAAYGADDVHDAAGRLWSTLPDYVLTEGKEWQPIWR